MEGRSLHPRIPSYRIGVRERVGREGWSCWLSQTKGVGADLPKTCTQFCSWFGRAGVRDQLLTYQR